MTIICVSDVFSQIYAEIQPLTETTEMSFRLCQFGVAAAILFRLYGLQNTSGLGLSRAEEMHLNLGQRAIEGFDSYDISVDFFELTAGQPSRATAAGELSDFITGHLAALSLQGISCIAAGGAVRLAYQQETLDGLRATGSDIDIFFRPTTVATGNIDDFLQKSILPQAENNEAFISKEAYLACRHFEMQGFSMKRTPYSLQFSKDGLDIQMIPTTIPQFSPEHLLRTFDITPSLYAMDLEGILHYTNSSTYLDAFPFRLLSVFLTHHLANKTSEMLMNRTLPIMTPANLSAQSGAACALFRAFVEAFRAISGASDIPSAASLVCNLDQHTALRLHSRMLKYSKKGFVFPSSEIFLVCLKRDLGFCSLEADDSRAAAKFLVATLENAKEVSGNLSYLESAQT